MSEEEIIRAFHLHGRQLCRGGCGIYIKDGECLRCEDRREYEEHIRHLEDKHWDAAEQRPGDSSTGL